MSLEGPEEESILSDDSSPCGECDGLSSWFSWIGVLDLLGLERMFTPIGNGSCETKDSFNQDSEISSTIRLTNRTKSSANTGFNI